MKFLIYFISLILVSSAYSQDHSKVLELINYARTNPKGFSEKVAEPYIEKNDLSFSRYSKSLLKNLARMKPVKALELSESLNIIANKYAIKAGQYGWTDHRSYNSRFREVDNEFDLTAENLDFGSIEELEIVMDLLIDEDIPSLGHRKNIFDPDLTHVGFGVAHHKKWSWIYVMDFGAKVF